MLLLFYIVDLMVWQLMLILSINCNTDQLELKYKHIVDWRLYHTEVFKQIRLVYDAETCENYIKNLIMIEDSKEFQNELIDYLINEGKRKPLRVHDILRVYAVNNSLLIKDTSLLNKRASLSRNILEFNRLEKKGCFKDTNKSISDFFSLLKPLTFANHGRRLWDKTLIDGCITRYQLSIDLRLSLLDKNTLILAKTILTQAMAIEQVFIDRLHSSDVSLSVIEMSIVRFLQLTIRLPKVMSKKDTFEDLSDFIKAVEFQKKVYTFQYRNIQEMAEKICPLTRTITDEYIKYKIYVRFYRKEMFTSGQYDIRNIDKMSISMLSCHILKLNHDEIINKSVGFDSGFITWIDGLTKHLDWPNSQNSPDSNV